MTNYRMIANHIAPTEAAVKAITAAYGRADLTRSAPDLAGLQSP